MATATISDVKEMLDEAGIDLEKQINDTDFGYARFDDGKELGNKIYVHQIPDLICRQALSPELHPHTMLFLGSSAIGKTYAVREGLKQAAQIMGRRHVETRRNAIRNPMTGAIERYVEVDYDTFHELHVSQMGPTDVNGIPRLDESGQRTRWFPPELMPLVSSLPEHEHAYQRFLKGHQETGEYNYDIMAPFPLYSMFLDEITNPSNPSIVHQLFSIIYGKYVADHKLVSDLIVVAAGNRATDGTNSINLAKSAVSRMGVYEAIPDLLGWMKAWAMQQVQVGNDLQTQVHPLVIAYLHRNSNSFAPIDNTRPPMEPYPSPRTWSYVSDMLYVNDRFPQDEKLLHASIASRIGVGEARLFRAFRDHWKELPDVNKILNSPDQKDGLGWLPAKWPTRPDILLIMVTQMIGKLEQRNARRFMTLMLDKDKFPPEYATTGMKLLRPASKVEPIAHTWAPDLFNKWAIANNGVLF